MDDKPTRQTVTLRLTPELKAALDDARGLIPMQRYIQNLLEQRVSQIVEEGERRRQMVGEPEKA